MRRFLLAIRVYLTWRLVVIFFMGISSGLPLLLTLSTLSYWLSTVGVSKTSIGLFAFVGLPYSFKVLWAPFVDFLRVPGLSSWLGQRRSWIVVAQGTLILLFLTLGTADPVRSLGGVALLILLIAFASATQDIVIDAYRIDLLSREEQGAGGAAVRAGYGVGMLLAGAGAIALSDFVSWSYVFMALAVVVALNLLIVLVSPEPTYARTPQQISLAGFIAPLVDFKRISYWPAVLALVLLYNFGDAITASMGTPFYHELGFSGTEIASVAKGAGFVFGLVGVFIGGGLVASLGLYRALWVGGILQAVTNLSFVWLAYRGGGIDALALAVSMDSLAGGMGGTAYVAFCSSLCNKQYSGTQYALVTSFMALGRIAFSAFGGALADHTTWETFFTLSTLLALPGLVLLGWLHSRVELLGVKGEYHGSSSD